MAFRSRIPRELTLPQYPGQHLTDDHAVIGSVDPLSVPAEASVEPQHAPLASAGGSDGIGPAWLSGAALRPQGPRGSFLHLQTASDSSASPGGRGGGGQWLPRLPVLPQDGGDDEIPASEDQGDGETVEGEGAMQGSIDGEAAEVGEGTWRSARYKAEILAHPLYEQLLSAHVACLRIATPVDQLPRIDTQLAQTQHIVSKYSALGAQMLADDKELDQFMVKEQDRIYCVSPGEGTGATMSDDDDDDDQADSETNMFDGCLDGSDGMGFGPLFLTESEKTLMERVRQELKHELKQNSKNEVMQVTGGNSEGML
ncbi:hypothetical protein BHM03_00007149 [Ensete ventricosum]|nr:hypothetical protein BHM03_00007149 [Ensete ventricosum]